MKGVNLLLIAVVFVCITCVMISGCISSSTTQDEEFTHAEAVYGVDNCGANWNEQAIKKAQSYLRSSAFSYEELMDQLEYEGFTAAQIQHALSVAYKIEDGSLIPENSSRDRWKISMLPALLL